MSHVRHRWRRRVAATIYRHLCSAPTQNPITLPHDAWSRLESLARQTNHARQRGWSAAARRSLQSLIYEADYVRNLLFAATAQWQPRATSSAPAGESDLVRDLIALETEFEALEYDEVGEILSVTTEAIVLDDIDLGPFELRLDLARLPSLDSLRVVAATPRPAASNDEVTHPHVQSERPCLGEGASACQKALEEGRLLDFFVIVGQVLATYAPGRAYVELEDWHALTCRECGDTASNPERCSECQVLVCLDCCGRCQACDGSYCHDCLRLCRPCDREVCHDCLAECSTCQDHVCPNCLEEDRCPACRHQDPNEEEDEPNQIHEDAPLQPHCLGETALSMRSG